MPTESDHAATALADALYQALRSKSDSTSAEAESQFYEEGSDSEYSSGASSRSSVDTSSSSSSDNKMLPRPQTNEAMHT